MAKRRKSFIQKLEQSKKKIFIGREALLQKFEQNIKLDPDDDEYLNFFNIYGQGGVGKTTLITKYKSICKSENYLTVLVDAEDTSLYQVIDTMNFIAEELDKQGHPFKEFQKKYKIYLQEKGKLEADPDKPKGTFGKIVKSGIKLGSKLGGEAIPGGRTFVDVLPIDTIAEVTGEWANFVVSKISNTDEVELILYPIKVLTPLWIKGLNNASEKNNISIFIDTFEASNPMLTTWLIQLLKEKYGRIHSILFVISGRNSLDPEKWSEFAPLTYKIELEPFSEAEAKNYLKQKGIEDVQTVDNILAISGRLPVYLVSYGRRRSNKSG